MDLEAGQLVDDRFEVLRATGGSDWRRRYEVLDRSSGDRFGLEIIEEAAARNAKRREDFLRQARVAQTLKHPNLLDVVGLGEHQGSPYLLTEHAPGESLASLMERQGRIDSADLTPIAVELCAALEFLHSQGIIHRDVRPDALIQGSDGRWKLRDFEMARDVGAQQTIALPGGAPPYRAPEQLLGRALDARSDIYAVGAVLFEALTGERPHEGVDVITRFMQPPPKVRESAADCPEAFAAAVEKCLEAEVDQRFADMASVAQALTAQPVREAPTAEAAPFGAASEAEVSPAASPAPTPERPPEPAPPPPPRKVTPRRTLADAMGSEPGRTSEVVATLQRILDRLRQMRAEGLHHAPLSPATIWAPPGAIEIDSTQPPEPGQTVAIRQPKYHAPEWLMETPVEGPDIERADLYALGFIAYEWLAGSDGFQKTFPHDDSAQPTMEWMRWQSDPAAQAPPLAENRSWVPRALSDVVGRMIAKDRSEALTSYEEADKALAAILARVEDTQHAGAAPTRRRSTRQADAGLPLWGKIVIGVGGMLVLAAAVWLLMV